MTKHLTAALLLAGTGLAQAHAGHGLPGLSHWHGDDALKLVGGSLLALAGWWLLRRK